jgi:hypothetical protein
MQFTHSLKGAWFQPWSEGQTGATIAPSLDTSCTNRNANKTGFKALLSNACNLYRYATGRRWCGADPIAPGFYQLLRGVYLYLNLLGMPTFTLISGYCSKVRNSLSLSLSLSLSFSLSLSRKTQLSPTLTNSLSLARSLLTRTQGFVRSGVAGDGAGLASRSRRMVESLLVPWIIWQVFYLVYNYSAVYPVQFWSPIGGAVQVEFSCTSCIQLTLSLKAPGSTLEPIK